MTIETTSSDNEYLTLVELVQGSGPRMASDDNSPRQYYCVYCFDVVVVEIGGYRLCERSTCIRKAISDRKTMIGEIELRKEKARRQLDAEERELQEKIVSLQQSNAPALLIAQYASILKSLRNGNRFHAINNRVDKALEFQRQIEELVAKLPRPAFSDEFRREIWERDARICYLCFKEIESWDGEHMELDRVEPRSKGGSDSAENLRPAHPSCNRTKGNRELDSRAMRAVLKEIRKTEAERQREFLF